MNRILFLITLILWACSSAYVFAQDTKPSKKPPFKITTWKKGEKSPAFIQNRDNAYKLFKEGEELYTIQNDRAQKEGYKKVYKASQLGLLEAKIWLAWFDYNHSKDNADLQNKSQKLLKGYVKQGVPYAYYKWGKELVWKHQDKKGIALLKRAFDLGLPDAATSLGLIFKDKRLPFFDLKKSYEWLMKAANSGEVSSFSLLAEIYFQGNDYFKKDINTAIKWLESAEKYNHWHVNQTLSRIYLTNELIPQLNQIGLKKGLNIIEISIKNNFHQSHFYYGMFLSLPEFLRNNFKETCNGSLDKVLGASYLTYSLSNSYLSDQLISDAEKVLEILLKSFSVSEQNKLNQLIKMKQLPLFNRDKINIIKSRCND